MQVAVPHMPFRSHDLASQLADDLHRGHRLVDVAIVIVGMVGCVVEAGHGVGEHGEPHRDVEPVEHVLGGRVLQIGPAGEVIGTVTEERDQLVRLYPLRVEGLLDPPARMFVDVGDEPEPADPTVVAGHCPAHCLEPAVTTRGLLARMHIPAVCRS